MGNFAMKLGFGIAIAAICLIAGVAAFEIWPPLQLNRDFDPIIYASRDGLCSVQPSADTSPYCPGVFLKDPAASPDGRSIAAVRPIGTKGGPPPHTTIVVTDRRGVVVRSLTDSEDFIRPVWAPEGQHIFAISYALSEAVGRWTWPSGDKTTVPVRNLDDRCRSGAPLSPAGRRAAIQGMSPSPSGRKAALLCDFLWLYIADVEPDSIRIGRTLTLSFSYLALATWLDDERLLAVGRMTQGAPANLWEIDTNSGLAQMVRTPGLMLRDYVTIAPDRSAVVVTATQPNTREWSLWRVELNDSRTSRLTRGSEDVAPNWAR